MNEELFQNYPSEFCFLDYMIFYKTDYNRKIINLLKKLNEHNISN